MLINKVEINNQQYDYDLNENIVKINNRDIKIEISRRFPNDYFEFLIDGKKIIVGLKKENNQITLNYKNRYHDTELIDSFSAMKKEMKELSGTSGGKVVVKAPMPGLVIKVNKNEGDNVNKGDTVLIIEAMKMENAIKSPTNGQIKSLKVSSGTSVAKNDILFEIA